MLCKLANTASTMPLKGSASAKPFERPFMASTQSEVANGDACMRLDNVAMQALIVSICTLVTEQSRLTAVLPVSLLATVAALAAASASMGVASASGARSSVCLMLSLPVDSNMARTLAMNSGLSAWRLRGPEPLGKKYRLFPSWLALMLKLVMKSWKKDNVWHCIKSARLLASATKTARKASRSPFASNGVAHHIVERTRSSLTS